MFLIFYIISLIACAGVMTLLAREELKTDKVITLGEMLLMVGVTLVPVINFFAACALGWAWLEENAGRVVLRRDKE